MKTFPLLFALAAAPALALDVQTYSFSGELHNYSPLHMPDRFEGTVRETFEEGHLVSVGVSSNLGSWFTTKIRGEPGSWSASLYLDDCLGVGFYEDAVFLSNSSPIYSASAHWVPTTPVPEPAPWAILALGGAILACVRRLRAR